ncbi:Trafficking protein particle complex II-specific subunit 130-like protein [Cercospora zeina]
MLQGEQSARRFRSGYVVELQGYRLPLRNLNWHSPPRPLRQIKSLHLDFVPDEQTEVTLRPTSRRGDADGPQHSLDIATGGGKTGKERRHQIPGFRTSPYLKLYVLRSDDSDTYKAIDRKRIREWVKEVAQPEGKQDHDAHEWLILHVVVPETVAASEPRWRESSRDPDDLKERKSGNKLIGKSTRTVFDRVRADFNDTGKSGVDRVAQIRIVKKEAPADLLPTPAVAQTYDETPQERENAWSDLISKLKSLILGPFDRRVRQYEADIAEQEARKSLPGWNFCTFFIHKEGLAMALESIGLVEDALAIYDELSIGLEVVLRELATGEAQGTATSFSDYTSDIQRRIQGPSNDKRNGDHDERIHDKHDAELLFSKDYRDGILRSSISVFDFMCYIFHRQKALLLRLANAQHARLEQNVKEGGEDLVLTAEVCWRASSFIHMAARALRQDQARGKVSSLEAEYIVCSWTWAVGAQVLTETAAPALTDVIDKGSHRTSNGSMRRPATSTGIGANTHPQRTSSLPDAQAAVELTRPQSRQPISGNPFRPATSTGVDPSAHGGLPGQADLATYRAELIMMQRRVLTQLARTCGWRAGATLANHLRDHPHEQQAINDMAHAVDADSTSLPVDVLSPSLKAVMRNERDFQRVYEHLTGRAIKHFGAATQQNSVEKLLGDLAMLKCQQDDWLSATTYLERIAPQEAHAGWDKLSLERLRIYAFCLKQLGRKQDFVRATLAWLSQIVRRRKTSKSLVFSGNRIATNVNDSGISGSFQDAIAAAADLEAEDVHPLKDFFGDVEMHRIVSHDLETDALRLSLSISHFLDDTVAFDEARVRLINVDDPTQEVWLENAEQIELQPGKNTIQLLSRTIAYGPYLIDTVELRVKQLRFVEHLRATPEPTPLGITVIEPTTTIRDTTKPPAFVFLYPRAQAFCATIKRARHTHIDKPRHLEIALHAGQNSITSVDIRLKPATAGLRLHLADASLCSIERDSTAVAKAGHLILRALAADCTAEVLVPYTTEQPTKEVMFRMELQYTTPSGTFAMNLPTKLANELPLDVDVHDAFQLDKLYSSFTVRTTSQTPLIILDAELDDSPLFGVEAPPSLPLPLPAFESQPVKLLYKITRKHNSEQKVLKRDAALAFKVQYEAIDELFLARLEHLFTVDIRQSVFGQYRRLLVPLLLDRARQSIIGSDLEVWALLGESQVIDFESVGWPELVATLPAEQRGPLEAWLRTWHENHKVLALKRTNAPEPQRITISVDVPNVDMVFSTALELANMEEPMPEPKILALGEAVTAKVWVRHTSCWSAKEVFPHVPTFRIHGEDERKNFVVHVESEDDSWLIGGQKRRHFVPEADAPCIFDIVLIPLRVGQQSLPTLDVQQEVFKHEIDETGERPTSTTCETHYESTGEQIHVVRHVQSTSVQIPDTTTAALIRPSSSRPGTSGTT